jgi:hypothetical protein
MNKIQEAKIRFISKKNHLAFFQMPLFNSFFSKIQNVTFGKNNVQNRAPVLFGACFNLIEFQKIPSS